MKFHEILTKTERDIGISMTESQIETRCVCETLMPPKYPSFEKHDPDI